MLGEARGGTEEVQPLMINSFFFNSFVEESLMEFKSEKGASLVEYALLVALIAVACIVAIRALGSKISQQFSYTAGQLG